MQTPLHLKEMHNMHVMTTVSKDYVLVQYSIEFSKKDYQPYNGDKCTFCRIDPDIRVG